MRFKEYKQKRKRKNTERRRKERRKRRRRERLKQSYPSRWQAVFKFFTYFISFEVSKSHL